MRARVTLLAIPAALGAQSVTGVAARNAVPVTGAVVVLEDSVGRAVARSTVGEGGRYVLRAPHEGTFRVRVLQIGWRPWSADQLSLTAGASVTRNLAVSSRRVVLDTVRVIDHSSCSALTDSSAAAFDVWEEARKALIGASLTGAEPLSITVTLSDRTFDASGTRLLGDSSSRRSGRTVKPFVTPPPDSLARAGYLSADNAATTYWAPDADVLLSDSFLATHCLSLVAPPESALAAQRIGAAFRPVTTRRGIADVSGVLWLDRASAELRSLDYTYVNVPPLTLAARAGGHMDFLRLPNGRWITARWSIRYPVIATRTIANESVVPGVSRTPVPANQIASIRVAAGEILSVRRGADTLWTRGTVSPIIRVVDSSTMRPLRSVLVGVASTGSATATDSLGVVRLPRVAPGPLTLRIESPRVARGADEPRLIAVDAPDANDAEIVVPIPSPDILATERCGNDIVRWDEGMVRVRRGAPTSASAFAIVRTPFIHLGAADTLWMERRMTFARDDAGLLYLCGVSRDATVQLADSATAPGASVRFATGERLLYLPASQRP